MDGVGMLGGEDLAPPYPWLVRNSVTVREQWMYPRPAIVAMIRLVASATLDLDHEQVTSFALDEVNEAIADAAVHPGLFDRTVLTPPRTNVDHEQRMVSLAVRKIPVFRGLSSRNRAHAPVVFCFCAEGSRFGGRTPCRIAQAIYLDARLLLDRANDRCARSRRHARQSMHNRRSSSTPESGTFPISRSRTSSPGRSSGDPCADGQARW